MAQRCVQFSIPTLHEPEGIKMDLCCECSGMEEEAFVGEVSSLLYLSPPLSFRKVATTLGLFSGEKDPSLLSCKKISLSNFIYRVVSLCV